MVKAVVVQDIHGEGGEQPGAIEYRFYRSDPEHIAGIAFRCPCGCGEESYLPIKRSDGAGSRDGWEFNGDLDAPSTTPSILQSGLPCKWHGYLTDGEFRAC